MKNTVWITLLMLFSTGSAIADWTLDNSASRLSFVSIKALDIAEVHRFGTLEGEIADNGKAVVSIDLTSVDTGIPIRNERMMEMLFETAEYPVAEARTRLDKALLASLQPGQSTTVDVELELALHGIRTPVAATLAVTRSSESNLIVTTIEPIILNAATIELADGIEALRKVANLPSISAAVPVTFQLSFVR